jgi:hypothetical protein
MEFKYYDPKILIPRLKQAGIDLDYSRICYGCVFTGVSPEFCFHPQDDFSEPMIQSDEFCQHCVDTIAENKKPFHLSRDKNLGRKVAELEAIAQMAS